MVPLSKTQTRATVGILHEFHSFQRSREMREKPTPSEGVRRNGKRKTAPQRMQRHRSNSTPSKGVGKWRGNATPSEGVQKSSTMKVGLGEVLATWGGVFLRIVIKIIQWKPVWCCSAGERCDPIENPRSPLWSRRPEYRHPASPIRRSSRPWPGLRPAGTRPCRLLRTAALSACRNQTLWLAAL